LLLFYPFNCLPRNSSAAAVTLTQQRRDDYYNRAKSGTAAVAVTGRVAYHNLSRNESSAICTAFAFCNANSGHEKGNEETL
jgi:hypothetical protein